jgi:hypothetical protein
LKEIERRRLFSAHKYTSLFEMAIKHFGYSEDEAGIRISAMRLLKELPEIEKPLERGELSLTHLALARTHFNSEDKTNDIKLTRKEKLDVLNKMENTSTRETKSLLLSLSSAPIKLPVDRIKLVSPEKVHVSFTANKEVEDQIRHLKGLLAHSNPQMPLGELFERLCELGIKEFSPRLELKREKSETPKSPGANRVKVPKELKPVVKSRLVVDLYKEEISSNQSLGETTKVDRTSDQPPMALSNETPNHDLNGERPKKPNQSAIHREVWRRDKGRCTNCGSNFAIEKDHRKPRALGGDSTLKNLRLLCRSCNQRAAIEEFGLGHMDQFLN